MSNGYWCSYGTYLEEEEEEEVVKGEIGFIHFDAAVIGKRFA